MDWYNQSKASVIRCHQRSKVRPFSTRELQALHGHEACHTGTFTHSLDDTINEKTSNFHRVPGYSLSSRPASSKHGNGAYQNSIETQKGIQGRRDKVLVLQEQLKKQKREHRTAVEFRKSRCM